MKLRINKYSKESKKEEVIFLLSLIVTLLAYQADIMWLVWVMGIKAGMDFVIIILFAIKSKKENK